MNDFEPTRTLEDHDHDLWHQGTDGLWRGTGADEDSEGLTFNELDQKFGVFAAR